MIKKLCYWNFKYDNLKESKRTLFFFLILMPVICISQILFTHFLGDAIGYLCWGILMLVLVFIRMCPTIYYLMYCKEYDEED